MTDLQIFEALCSVIEQQEHLILELITALKQADALSGKVAERLDALESDYDTATGKSEF